MKSAALGELALIFNGKTPSEADKREAGHPVLKIRDVRDNGQFSGKFESFVEAGFAEKHSDKMIRRGDVMVLNAAHNAEYVGSKLFRATAEVDGALATGEWLLARSKNGRLDQSYLWHWFQAPSTRWKIRRMVKGIHLYPRDVAKLQLPIPALNEQRRIATILDRADDVRQKHARVRALADDFLKSTFLDMFGDPVRNQKKLPTIALGELIKVSSGSGLTAKNMDPSGEYPVYGGNGINGYHSEFMFEEPKIVIGRVGVYCGAVHVTPSKAWITDNALYVREVKRPVNLTFLEWALRFANLNQYADRAAQPLISGNRIYPIEIVLPSDREQRAFALIADRQGKLRSHLEDEGVHADDLFASIAQHAFSG